MNGQFVALLFWSVVFSVPGVIVAAWLLSRVRQAGGRVPTAAYGLPDLLVAFFLCGFFGLLVALHGQLPAKGGPDAPVSLEMDAVIPNAVFFIGLIALLVGFLHLRKISAAEVFGWRTWPWWRALLTGLLLVAAVFPLLAVWGNLVPHLLGESAREQEVVTLLRDQVRAGQSRNIALLVIMAVIVQPIAEEVLFRGYFYAVFKGWAGALASAVFTSVLFATIHLSLTAWPVLLLLALALTLAYEWSGSLKVPIFMHMAFNGVQIAMMAWAMRSLPE